MPFADKQTADKRAVLIIERKINIGFNHRAQRKEAKSKYCSDVACGLGI
jgi:hypothetical protein